MSLLLTLNIFSTQITIKSSQNMHKTPKYKSEKVLNNLFFWIYNYCEKSSVGRGQINLQSQPHHEELGHDFFAAI